MEPCIAFKLHPVALAGVMFLVACAPLPPKSPGNQPAPAPPPARSPTSTHSGGSSPAGHAGSGATTLGKETSTLRPPVAAQPPAAAPAPAPRPQAPAPAATPRCTGEAVIGTLDVDGNGVLLNGRQARDGDLVCEDDSVTTDDTSFADLELKGGGYVHIDRGTDPRFARQRSGERCVVVHAFSYGQVQLGARSSLVCFLVRTADVTFAQRGGLVNVSVPKVRAPAPAPAPAPGPAPKPAQPGVPGAKPQVIKPMVPLATLASIKPLGTTVTVIHGPPVQTLSQSISVSALKSFSASQINSQVQGAIAAKEAVVYNAGTRLQVVKVVVPPNRLPPELDWSRRSPKLAPKVMLPPN